MRRMIWLVPRCALLFFLASFPMLAQVSFFQPPSYAGGGANLFVADFNGDGKPDLLCSDGTLNVGTGNGAFNLGTPVPGTPLAVADFNGDGKSDILEQGNGTLLVLLGNGDGTFQPAITSQIGVTLVTIIAGDMNGDGRADVIGLSSSFVFIFLSKGDGTFASGVSYSLGTTPQYAPLLSLGDLNGDGKIDVVVSASGATTFAAGEEIVFLGNGDGTLQAAKTSAGNVDPMSAAIGDFNNDGKPDLVLEGCSDTNCTSLEQGTGIVAVFFLLGNGDGTFQAPTIAFSSVQGPLAAADVNGDGNLDLVVGGETAQIFLGSGHGTFTNASNYVSSFGNSGLVMADFNHDGKLDIATGNTLLLGNGTGSFPGIPLGVAPATTAATGDFDKNGTLDVVAISGTNVSILSNGGAGALSLTHTYTLQQPASAAVAEDFNGDGNLDLLVIGSDPTSKNWSYSLLLGNGDGSFQSPVFYPQNVILAGNFRPLVVADFNRDHRPDFAVAAGSQSLAVLLGNGDGTFSSPVYYFEAATSPLLVADFNSDGKLDIAVGSGILFGNGDGTFQSEVFPTALSNFNALFAADVNSDGKADLLSYSQVALGNGDGTFNVLPPLSPQGSIGVVGIADINQDGKPDLLVTRSNGVVFYGVGIEDGNGDGTFGPYTDIGVLAPLGAYLPNNVLTADMNGDGLPDIVFPWFGGVGVLLNTTQATVPADFQLFASAFSPAPIGAGASVTSTVTAAPLRGFNGGIALSCTGVPTGATCVFNPSSISAGSGTSTLTVATVSSLPAGLYTLVVTGASGSISHTVPLTLNVMADFTMSLASGSPSSQTLHAGQNASFSLLFAPTGSFTGTLKVGCAVTPVVTPAPTCTPSSSSVQISGSGTQSVTVTVGTTAPVTSGRAFYFDFPSGLLPFVCTLTLSALAWLKVRNCKRSAIVFAPFMLLALALVTSCGGGGSPLHQTPGTPAGTYTVTVTATSGSLSHNSTLQVIVQ